MVPADRNSVHIRIRHKRGHNPQQAGSRTKADRKEPCWHRSQDHSRVNRALALPQFLHNRLDDGCGRDGAHAHDDGVYDARDLGLPTRGWTSTRKG